MLSGSYVNIGANDGLSDDPLAHYARSEKVKACKARGEGTQRLMDGRFAQLIGAVFLFAVDAWTFVQALSPTKPW